MEFVRLLSAGVFGAIVYFLASSGQVPMALGAIAFLVVMQAGWTETRLQNIANSLDFNFERLRHLHRNPLD